MNPLISVIIPLYNKEAIIECTIQSVLSQSFEDFELIIVNDGSTDNSVEVVQGIKDNRIIFIEQDNGGPSKARNTGVVHSHGEWIFFLDADDELAEGALEHFCNLTKKHKGVELFCAEFSIKNGSYTNIPYTYNNTIVKNGYKSWFIHESCPRTGATLYSRSLVLQCPFDERIRRYEDLECLFRMFRHTELFLSHQVVLTMNADYAAASSARPYISEDFLGYMDFKNKSFWEYMSLYQFYLGEREHYPKEVRRLYPRLHRRYDLLILYKLLLLVKRKYVF